MLLFRLNASLSEKLAERTAITRTVTVGIIIVILVIAAAVGIFLATTPSHSTTTTGLSTTSTTQTTQSSFAYPVVTNVPQNLTDAFYPATPVTLSMYEWSGIPPQYMIQQFEAAFPNIHIQSTPNQDVSGLLSALDTHQHVYDGFRVLYSLLPQEVSTGEVMNIGPWFNQYLGYLKQQITPAAFKLVSAGKTGAMYCIPEDFAPVALDYRADIFNKYGLTVPTTWAQFAQDAAKLHTENSSIYMTIFPPNEPSSDLMALFSQGGGNMIVPAGNNSWNVVINSTKNINVINFWGNLISAGSVTAMNLYTPQYDKMLTEGQIASFVTAAAWYPGYLIEPTAPNEAGLWRVANMPQWNSTGPFVSGQISASCIGVTANSVDPRATFLYAFYTTQTPQVLPWMWVNEGQWTSNTYNLANLKYPNGSSVFLSNASYFGGQDIGQVYLYAQEHMPTQWVWSPFQITIQTILQEQITEAAAGQITFASALQNTETIMIQYVQSSGGTVVGVGH